MLEVNENYVNTSVMLSRGNSYARGDVIGQKRDAYGNFVGRENDNPILDTREYSAEFDDWEVRKLTTIVIAESIYAACNDSVKDYLMMVSIVQYRKSNNDLSVSSQKMVHIGHSYMHRSTVGWQLCVQWRDESTSWQALKDLKESHPVDTVEYVVAQEIYHDQ